jgi:hypothetical protein
MVEDADDVETKKKGELMMMTFKLSFYLAAIILYIIQRMMLKQKKG